MSQPTAIHAWLKSAGPFAAGIALLESTGCDDDALLFTLSLGETTVSRAALTEALKVVHQQHVQATMAVAIPEGKPLMTRAEIEQEREELKQSVKLDGYQDIKLTAGQAELRDKGKNALREMSYYRSHLETLPSDDDRHREALLVVKLDLVAVRAFARLDAWLATGRDPGAEPIRAELTESEMRQEVRNIDSYLSRVAKGRRVVSMAKQQEWQDRKAELIKKLDAIQP